MVDGGGGKDCFFVKSSNTRIATPTGRFAVKKENKVSVRVRVRLRSINV